MSNGPSFAEPFVAKLITAFGEGACPNIQQRFTRNTSRSRQSAQGACFFAAAIFLLTNSLILGAAAQTPVRHPAKTRIVFEVASIRPDKSTGRPRSDFPIGPGRVYVPRGGIFRATHVLLFQIIGFAFDMTHSQMMYIAQHVPDWVASEGFDITARAEGKPNEDQLRVMMQSLLADRFKLAIHKEKRQLPVLALVLAKPGHTGHISWYIRLIHHAQILHRPPKHGRPSQETSRWPAMELFCSRRVLPAECESEPGT